MRFCKLCVKLNKNSAEDVREFDAEEEVLFCSDHRGHKGQVDAAYSSAGDKYSTASPS